MPQPNAPAQRYYVVTYAKHPGQDEPDVLAEGEVAVPAGNGNQGDLVEGVLSQTENFQCDGHGHGTDGCDANHAHAVERVRARLTGADGTVAVVYRKYHPLVGHGTAEPGKPYEVECDGLQVRVEVRKILEQEAEGLTDDSVSLVTLRQMQQDLAPKVQVTSARMRVRSAFAKMLDTHFEAVKEQIEERAQRYADLPDADAVKAATKEVEAAAQALVDEASQVLTTAIEDPALNDASAKQHAASIDQIAQRFGQIFGPFDVIEQQAQRLIATQAGVRTQLTRIDDLCGRLDDAEAVHKKLGFDNKPLLALAEDLAKLMERTKTDGLDGLDAIDAEVAAFPDRIAEQGVAIDTAIAAAEAKARVFAARVAAHDLWRASPDEAVAELKTTIASAGAFAEVPLAYWSGRAEALPGELGQLTDVSGLAYDDRGAEKKLAAAEKELAPVQKLLDALSADMKDVAVGAYMPVVGVDGAAFVAPTTWGRVEKEYKNGKRDVDVHVINNDARAMKVEVLVGPDQAVQRELVLSERGQRLSMSMAKIEPPVAFRVTAVVPDGGAPPVDGKVTMRAVDVPSADLVLEREGATHFNLPMNWTPPQQALGAESVVETAVADDVRVARQPILGAE